MIIKCNMCILCWKYLFICIIVLNESFACLCSRCPFLHRTAGDTERRYHLRYYKTGSCIHETDAKGHCSKNGSHCAFAHGSHDLRSPVYDIRCHKNFTVTCNDPTSGSVCVLSAAVAHGFLDAVTSQRSAGNGVSGRRRGHRGERRRRAVGTGSKYSPHREDPEWWATLAR